MHEELVEDLDLFDPDVNRARIQEYYLVSSERRFGELALAASKLDGYAVEAISLEQLKRHIPGAYDKEGTVPTMILVYPEGSKSGDTGPLYREADRIRTEREQAE